MTRLRSVGPMREKRSYSKLAMGSELILSLGKGERYSEVMWRRIGVYGRVLGRAGGGSVVRARPEREERSWWRRRAESM